MHTILINQATELLICQHLGVLINLETFENWMHVLYTQQKKGAWHGLLPTPDMPGVAILICVAGLIRLPCVTKV